MITLLRNLFSRKRGASHRGHLDGHRRERQERIVAARQEMERELERFEVESFTLGTDLNETLRRDAGRLRIIAKYYLIEKGCCILRASLDDPPASP